MLWNFCSSQETVSTKKIDSIYNSVGSLSNEEGLVKMTELYYQSKEINYKKGQINTLARLAQIESVFYNFKKAHQHIEELKALALSEENYRSYIFGCSLESNIYLYDQNYTKALKILDDASKYIDKIEDEEVRRGSRIIIEMGRRDNFWYSEQPAKSYNDSIYKISKKIYREALLLKKGTYRQECIVQSSIWLARSLIENKNLPEANQYLNIANNQLKQISSGNYLIADYHDTKGDFEYLNKDKNKNYLDSALVHYNKALKKALYLKYPSVLTTIYQKIAKVHKDQKNIEKENYFLLKNDKINDSINSINSTKINEVKPKIYPSNQTKAPENKYSWLYILGLLFLLSTVIFYFLRRKSFNSKKIISPISTINEIASETGEPQIVLTEHLLSLLKNNDTSFYTAFVELYPEFQEKLLKINPTLKSSDIEFCAYIKLNLDTKQIAQYKNISVRAAESKKYRLRKKFNLSTEEDLHIWMSRIN